MAGAAGCAAIRHSLAQPTCLASESGCGLDVALPHREREQLRRGSEALLQAAPQYQQTGVLTRVERIRRVGSGAKAELVWLIVISRPVTVQRACGRDVIRGRGNRHLCGDHPFRPGSWGSGRLVSPLCARRGHATSVSVCPMGALQCAAVRFLKCEAANELGSPRCLCPTQRKPRSRELWLGWRRPW
jgi:hypothetical protein